ncbi:MAG TPA: cytochrome c, partial [Paracoccaceae bacterium]|nr:cytochrome c [Paracoccaceae bacterium]
VCAACHMPDAMGAVGAGFYPALANNPRLIASRYPAYIVMKGMNGMPPMGDMLTDEQAAAVVTYVRTNFGNNYPQPVTAAEMAALR